VPNCDDFDDIFTDAIAKLEPMRNASFALETDCDLIATVGGCSSIGRPDATVVAIASGARLSPTALP